MSKFAESLSASQPCPLDHWRRPIVLSRSFFLQPVEPQVELNAASRQRYGRPRIQRALQRHGVRVSGKRVGRLLRLEGLRGKRSRRFVVPPLGQNPPVPGGFHPYLRITP
jgi:transposase InsO family protein